MLTRALIRRASVFACVAMALIVLGVGLAGRAPDVRIVKMLDRCDPETFNAAFGDGTCIFEHPGVTVETFLRVLGNAQTIGSWHFSPRQLSLKEGQAYQAQNDGGEVHTFTEVAEFGGGFIDELNDLTGNPVPAPECLDFPNLEFIPAGGLGTPDVDEPGTHKYMCCIHPWMRATVTVR
jgi:plastocyanin